MLGCLITYNFVTEGLLPFAIRPVIIQKLKLSSQNVIKQPMFTLFEVRARKRKNVFSSSSFVSGSFFSTVYEPDSPICAVRCMGPRHFTTHAHQTHT